MPDCCRTNQDTQEVEEDDWPEPAGYLGEAVRRAKLIGRAKRAVPQVPDVD